MREFGKACYEAGKFLELRCNEHHPRLSWMQSRNAKQTIDWLMEKGFISRQLGSKLHCVRELRNAAAHPLSYEVTAVDAAFALDTVGQFHEWEDKSSLISSWHVLRSEFNKIIESVDTELDSAHGSTDEDKLGSYVLRSHTLLLNALEVKFESMRPNSKDHPRLDIYRMIEVLDKVARVNVRSEAWSRLVRLRNSFAHTMINPDEDFGLKQLGDLLREVVPVFEQLRP
jgi:hypothetical protein